MLRLKYRSQSAVQGRHHGVGTVLVLLSILTFAPAAVAQTTATWLDPLAGEWTDASRWSTAPFYPNNGTPAGESYDVLIDAVGTNAYTVSFGSGGTQPQVVVDSIQLGAQNALLRLRSGRLETVNGLQLNSGTLWLSGATVAGIIEGSGGDFRITSPSGLDGVVLRRAMTLGMSGGDPVTITNGFTHSMAAPSWVTPSQE